MAAESQTLYKETPNTLNVISSCGNLITPGNHLGSSVLSLPPYTCMFSDGQVGLTECISPALQKNNTFFCRHTVREYGSTVTSY